MVSSLTGQFQSHSASPIQDGRSPLSKAISASHVKISPFAAWESRDERLLRPFTWVCFPLWDDYDISHHMCHLPTPGDCAGEIQWTITLISHFRAFGFPVVFTTTAEVPVWELFSWILKVIFTLGTSRKGHNPASGLRASIKTLFL